MPYKAEVGPGRTGAHSPYCLLLEKNQNYSLVKKESSRSSSACWLVWMSRTQLHSCWKWICWYPYFQHVIHSAVCIIAALLFSPFGVMGSSLEEKSLRTSRRLVPLCYELVQGVQARRQRYYLSRKQLRLRLWAAISSSFYSKQMGALISDHNLKSLILRIRFIFNIIYTEVQLHTYWYERNCLAPSHFLPHQTQVKVINLSGEIHTLNISCSK